jgi:hypothetical protein
VRFCFNCGKNLIETELSNEDITINSSNSNKLILDSSKIKFIFLNIGLILIFFLDWVKITGTSGLMGDLFLSDIGFKSSFSPNFMIELINQVKSLAVYSSDGMGVNLPVFYNIFYILMAIPLLGAAAIVLLLFKKDKLSRASCLISSISASLAAIVTIIYTSIDNENIGVNYGVIIALGVGISSLIFVNEITKNDRTILAAGNIAPPEEDFTSEQQEEELFDQDIELGVAPISQRIVICGYCGYEDNEYGRTNCVKCGNELYYGPDNTEPLEDEQEKEEGDN